MENEIIKNTFFSSISGICSRVILHPFDTVKSRIQTTEKTKIKMYDCFRSMVKNEGWLSLYK
jgi:hypothetical protein